MTDTLTVVTEWTQPEAVELCRKIESFCPGYGCHVGLTGGCLYKDGTRKDVDLVFYRIRQTPEIDIQGLLDALTQDLGLTDITGFGFCYKEKIGERGVDMFFPESYGGDYDRCPEEDMPLSDFELGLSNAPAQP